MEKTMKSVMVLAVLLLTAAWPALCAETQEGGSGQETAVEQQGTGAEGQEGGKGYRQHGFKDMFKDLDLTAEQKEQLKAKREAGKESNQAVREQMKTKMQALHELIAKPETKRADVDGLLGEISALKAQMFVQKIDGLFAMKEILTPEQFAKMEAKRKERMEKKGKQCGWGRQEEGSGPEQD